MASFSFPFGFRFAPTDEELITHYLWNKISGQPLPLDGIVIEKDVYGDNGTPWELFRDHDGVAIPWQNVVDSLGKLVETEVVVYVFTRLTRVGKIKGTKQKNRAAGCGTWHGNNAAEYVCDGNRNQIGKKKTFKFRHANHDQYCEWIMHEYSLLDSEDYVLCKIKRITKFESHKVVPVPVPVPVPVVLNKHRREDDHQVAATEEYCNVESTEEEDDIDALVFGKKTTSTTISHATSTHSEIKCPNEGSMNNINGVVLQEIPCATTTRTTMEEANFGVLDQDGFLGIINNGAFHEEIPCTTTMMEEANFGVRGDDAFCGKAMLADKNPCPDYSLLPAEDLALIPDILTDDHTDMEAFFNEFFDFS